MIIFIIPYHRVGGAERVHSEIIRSIAPFKKVFIVFDHTDGSLISPDFTMYNYIVIGKSMLKRLLFVMALIISSHIFSLVLFGCNSYLFYYLLPLVAGKTEVIDLTHAFSYPDIGIEDYAKKYIPYISKRIVINNKTLEDYKSQYLREGIDLRYMERFVVIPNGISIKEFDEKLIVSRHKNFVIGYVGRFAQEKRPELFLRLSQMEYSFPCASKIISDKFETLISDYSNLKTIIGINDPIHMRQAFSEISLLIVPSVREGFPLVIMEAMELGIPVISTNVGSVQEHVKNEINGYLTETDEELFLDFSYKKIELLGNNEELYTTLSHNARHYAEKYFSVKKMQVSYRKLFLNE